MTTPQIAHLADRHRFECTVDGLTCLLDYKLHGGMLAIMHTEVPVKLSGRGIAGALTQAALAHAREAGIKVQPLCSYARDYMRRHPETADLLA